MAHRIFHMVSGRSEGVLRHATALRRYARALTRDAGAAEDLVQETLLVAHERQAELNPARSIRGWLFAVLHNRFIGGRRRAKLEADRLPAMAARYAPVPTRRG